MIVAALDPGVNAAGTGHATAGRITSCSLHRPPAFPRRPLAPAPIDAILATGTLAAQALLALPFDVVVVEYPEVYSDSSTRAEDPNDLLMLALQIGWVLSRLHAAKGAIRVLPVRPRLWTKQVAKAERQANFLRKRSPQEKAIVEAVLPKGLRHNAIDGAHLALWGFEYLDARSPAVVETATFLYAE